MEDNFINKKTVDQAWNTMKDVLDKEMPVGVRSRRFPYSTCILGGVLLLGLSCTVYFSLSPSTANQEQKIRPIQSEISKEVAINESTNRNTKDIKSDINIGINEREESTEKTQIESIQTDAKSNRENQVQSNKFIKSNESNESKIVNTMSDSKSASIAPITNVTSDNSQLAKDALEAKSTPFENSTSANSDAVNDDVVNIDAANIEIAKLSIANSAAENKEVEKESSIDDQHIARDKKNDDDIVLSEEPLIVNTRTGFISAPILELMPSYTKLTKNIKYLNTKMYNDIPRSRKVEWTINYYVAQRVGAVRPIIGSSIGVSSALEVLLSNKINGKWRIGVGLGYKRSGRTASISFAANALGGGFDASSVNADELEVKNVDNAFNTGSVTTAFLVRRTQFISLPLFATRKLGARWATDIGVRYNQKIGDFGSIFFEDSRVSNVDFFLTPTYRLSRHWSFGLMFQYSTNQFDHTNTIISKELGKIQLGLSARYRI